VWFDCTYFIYCVSGTLNYKFILDQGRRTSRWEQSGKKCETSEYVTKLLGLVYNNLHVYVVGLCVIFVTHYFYLLDHKLILGIRFSAEGDFGHLFTLVADRNLP
jgi:hypothetical protein